jgi:4-carboxymuconolactone decarboxylase
MNKKALDFMNSLDPGASEAMAGMIAVFPDLVNPFIERLYGDVYQRDQLKLRERLLVTVAVLMASGKPEPQIAIQLRFALKNGVSREELMEVALQISVFNGFATGISAAHVIDAVADEVEISSIAAPDSQS